MKILLWEKRKQKNLTLLELSKLTDLGKSTLNDLENEKYSPTMQQMEQIAKGMNLKITDLFDSEYK
ncbi:MAG: helix-turn-helix transcriptional regulator [Lachnospiraceae bacterium]|nr:helix-turn-helix transcriptional regulator [Lachnospiraceae bacterium]